MPILRAAAIVLGLAATAGTAGAQPVPDEPLLPEGMERALREMMDEMKPALDEMLDYMRTFDGAADPRHYELPEVLPNGDIIIRRREDAPPYRPDEPEERGRDPLPGGPEEGVRT